MLNREVHIACNSTWTLPAHFSQPPRTLRRLSNRRVFLRELLTLAIQRIVKATNDSHKHSLDLINIRTPYKYRQTRRIYDFQRIQLPLRLFLPENMHGIPHNVRLGFHVKKWFPNSIRNSQNDQCIQAIQQHSIGYVYCEISWRTQTCSLIPKERRSHFNCLRPILIYCWKYKWGSRNKIDNWTLKMG